MNRHRTAATFAAAAVTIGVVPVAALAVASLQASVTSSLVQCAVVSVIAAGLYLAATEASPNALKGLRRKVRRAVVVCGLGLIAATGGCTTTTTSATSQQDPATPVREYFAALAQHDTATAYQLSRSASAWLSSDGLAHGYQPPTSLRILSTTFAASSGDLAYVRATYQLAATAYESTFEVWKTISNSPQWTIIGGATGRLDVISPQSPHVMIANVAVDTPLAGPRISGGTPGAGYFEVPPGVYTVALAPDPALRAEPAEIAVPATSRDGTPVSVTLQAEPAPPPGPAPAGTTPAQTATLLRQRPTARAETG